MKKAKNVITIILIGILIVCCAGRILGNLFDLAVYGTQVSFIALRGYIDFTIFILLVMLLYNVCKKNISLEVNKMFEITITPEEKRISAYHEAGHALVSSSLGIKVNEVCILSNDNELGHTGYGNNDIEEKYIVTQKEYKYELAILLAGREAEREIFKENSTECIDDIKKATKIARYMVTHFGMTNNVISFRDLESEEIQEFGPDICNKVGSQVEILLKEAEEKAKEIIKINRDLLEKIAQALIEKKQLSGEELEEIFEDED